jgi:DtxR family transcriptional regulator, Mn-dependent transcriptional regulator
LCQVFSKYPVAMTYVTHFHDDLPLETGSQIDILIIVHNLFQGIFMTGQIILSKTEEMYLVTIRKICEHCTDTPVPIPEIARELGVQPVTVNQMVNKLAENGFATYKPYKGVELTAEGRAISTQILRHRRLWEVFLIKSLKMDLDSADQLACQIEHFTSRDVANRLSKFLGDPKVCFHGDPIPLDDAYDPGIPEGVSLESLKIGQSSQVIRINGDAAITKFLAAEGIHPGIQISLLAIGNNGALLIGTEDKHTHLSAELVSSIIISNSTHNRQSRKEKPMSLVPLSDLSIGQKGIIQKINFKGSLRQRLFAMGLVTGETIQIKRIAPLGDPIDFIVKGYDLSLRKSEAENVLVTLASEE